MWKPSQGDRKGGVRPDDSKNHDRPTQRRRWDAISDPKQLPSHLEYSPPRSSRWNASTQVPSERRLQQRSLEYNSSSSSSSRPIYWDVSTQVPSEPKLRSSSHIMEYVPSRPARIAGGNGCNCCPCPPCPERLVESCLRGLHQKYVDVYDSKKCIEGHLPAGYRSFVEHDDLYLPPSRPLSPASTDHDDVYLPLKTCDVEYSPRCPCPCDLRICDSDPTYGDIYLPPSRPCTPAFPKDPCGYPPPYNPCNPCPPPPCNPCNPCKPCPSPPCPPPSCPPPRMSSCGPKIQCSCPLYIKKLAPCPAPPSNDCSCPPYIKKLPGCSSPPSFSPHPSPPCSPTSCIRSRPVQQCSSVYIDEVPSPPVGNRYIACQECLCHKDISTRSLCPSPKRVSPCRDCVCHLGARSPSQGCPPKFGTHTRCPGKPRLKLHLNQSQCLDCKSPYSCKGPSNCNPQYIVETLLSPNSVRSRSPSPGLRSRSPMRGGNNCSPMSSRCQSCDCHKSPSSGCSVGPSKVSPKLFEDPCCSPCRPVTPCRPLLAAEMLIGMEACASQAKASGKSPSSCMDPRCATCECHGPKCPPSPPPPCRPPSPPPCSSPCSSRPPPNSSCRSSCSSPCRPPAGPPCFDDDVHNPTFKSFQSTSPRCKDCDCHKPKNCKLSTQICKFCRGAGWCYCEYHTPQQLLADFSEQSTSRQRDEVEDNTQVSGVLLKALCEEDSSEPAAFHKEMPPMQSDVTQLCCCGKCEYTKPRFPIKTECPFCKHTHSCCCGMCSCPIPSCSSKTPLALGGGPTPRGLSLNSSGASTGRSSSVLTYNHRLPKSTTTQQAPRRKLGFTSPDKSSPKPFSTSSGRLCYSSQKTQMKLSVQQSPTRR